MKLSLLFERAKIGASAGERKKVRARGRGGRKGKEFPFLASPPPPRSFSVALAPIFAPPKREKCLERAEKPTETLASQATRVGELSFQSFRFKFSKLQVIQGNQASYFFFFIVWHLICVISYISRGTQWFVARNNCSEGLKSPEISSAKHHAGLSLHENLLVPIVVGGTNIAFV